MVRTRSYEGIDDVPHPVEGELSVREARGAGIKPQEPGDGEKRVDARKNPKLRKPRVFGAQATAASQISKAQRNRDPYWQPDTLAEDSATNPDSGDF